MDEPGHPGSVVPTRIVGIIQGEQIDGKERVRNDRLVGIAAASHEYAEIKRLDDLPSKWIHELETFFVNYHGLEGKNYRLLGCKQRDTALGMIRKQKQA